MKPVALLTLAALLFIITQCSVTHKTSQIDQIGETSSRGDSLIYEIPEDAIEVRPAAYQPSYTIINDLVHTQLKVSFDWKKMHLFGKAYITLKPHFYETDSLRLDAKGFDIHQVELVKTGGNLPLKYSYDSSSLYISLDKKYRREEQYTIYISYTAKPNELQVKGSAAINDARGLYFINADGKDPEKPRQLWTQGETESSSAWFPTIDKPNMKMTTELSMTVEDGFVTLSNGMMISSKSNGDGTHTDTWKMELPYAPYLVMMAAGPFTVVKDHFKELEVNYYLDKKYAPYAKKIFGNTPEMIDFFSKRLGVPYAWPKYSQVVVHDFVTGAMENVSATVFFDKMQQTSREMIDGNHEDIISHELFHQWFGDLITCESWSNLPLNESFATYGEYLWNEYKYGRDEADFGNNNDLNHYLYYSRSVNAPLIRYEYDDKEEVFDAISYQKGGRILHMLRKYVGDEAFFLSLKTYLESNRFGTAEVHQLRLAFEKVTGEDLNWFFDQWFLSPGHPILDIQYNYDSISKLVVVTLNQIQDAEDMVFRLPINVDIYENGTKTRREIVMNKRQQTFSFSCDTKPDLVNTDADKSLVCEKSDNKSDTSFAFQIEHAPLFMDRLEALQFFSDKSDNSFYSRVMLRGLNDTMWAIRTIAAQNIVLDNDLNGELKKKIISMASSDPKSHVRAAAIEQLGQWNDHNVEEVIENSLRDSSYLVISTALSALLELDSIKAFKAAQFLENDSSDEIISALGNIYSNLAGPDKNDFLLSQLNKDDVSYDLVSSYGIYLSRMIGNPEVVQEALSTLYDIAQNDDRWYVRFAAINTLMNSFNAMAAQKETWKNQLMQPTKETEESQNLATNLEWITTEMSALDVKIESIKTSETDENLRRILNSQ